MIEKELKYMCTEKEFNLIKMYISNEFVNVDNYINYNYYIISKKIDLKKLGISLRLRKVNNSYEKTAKLKKLSDFNNLSIKEEYTYEIEKFEFENLINHEKIKSKELFSCDLSITNMLLSKNIFELCIINKPLKTIRNKFLINNEVTLCLDKNYYLNNVDYEIEVELIKDNYNEIIKLIEIYFNNLSISPAKGDKSKSQRFLDKYYNGI